VVFSLSIGYLLGFAEVFESDGLELDAEIFADDLAAREDRDVFEHCLAAIAKAGCLNGSDIQRAAEFVHNESRESFALDVLSDDQHRAAHLRNLLQDRQQVSACSRSFSRGSGCKALRERLHAVGVGDEVRRKIAAVELHSLDNLEQRVHRLRLSTVMTPSLPTLSIASAMIVPIVLSPFADTVPT
jgi:hypothetical protein